MARVRSLPVYHPLLKAAAVCVIAAVGMLAGLAIQRVAGSEASEWSVDWSAYDLLYKLRPPEDRTGGPIVLVTIDEYSLAAVDKFARYAWPWPREMYAGVIKAADEAGARAVVFDLTFDRSSIYDAYADDSKSLGEAADAARIPIIFAANVESSPGSAPPFVIPTKRGIVAAADLPKSTTVLRSYPTQIRGRPTLGMAAATAVKPEVAELDWGDSFLLHYYGPYARVEAGSGNGRPTHRRVSIADLVLPVFGHKSAELRPVDPSTLKGKILVVGSTAQSLWDLKSSPHSAFYPGMAYHATAIENLLEASRVYVAGRVFRWAMLVLPCVVAGWATIALRRTVFKLAVPLAAGVAVVLVIYFSFRALPIVSLPPMAPLTGLGVATVLGLTWSYFTEGRQRAYLARAFGQYVSPAVVAELERDPAALTLGGRRRTVTVLFSDIRSFTTISEKLEPQEVERFMNAYLGGMTEVVLAGKGTVDKYIGDAVMAFWNAPLDQSDHAACAAEVALGMIRRERADQETLRALAGEEIYTRVGIATGEVTVGNFGSAEKVNYTALGDSVNLAARLEGANKIYGSQVLMAEATALAAQERVLVRKLGLLQVKGKTRGVAVYEALGVQPGTAEERDRKVRYEAAFGEYLRREWGEARRILEWLIADHPEDAPARKLLEAVGEFEAEPPGADWDGVYVAHEK